MNLIWSPLAIEKLRDISTYISLDNQQAAHKWINELLDLAESLTTNPEIGRKVPELSTEKYRELIYGNYRLIYKVSDNIQILTVRNCRQLLCENDV